MKPVAVVADTGSVVAQGLRDERLLIGEWGGMVIGFKEARCSGEMTMRCTPSQGMRLTIVLEEKGGRVEPRLDLHRPCADRAGPQTICLLPATEPLWGVSRNIRGFRKLSVRFDTDTLRERMQEDIVPMREFSPRLRFADDGIWQLGRLLADEMVSAYPACELYTDSLLTALLARLAHIQSEKPYAPQRGGLTKQQLRVVTDFIHAHLADSIGLRDLAALTGLSQSHFCRAFKAATGMSPHRWHLQARIGSAQQLLIERRLSITEVALATGFADQSHFSKVFARLTGSTPAVWRRAHL